ncbi:MAG: transporter associated domain-containing protein [Sideroxydans sp.]|nr:transporter associated domain-containing protein [Sideroxydans sp.]
MDGSESSRKPTLLERLSTLLLREPEDREQLIALLHSAYERNLLDADALSMMEGVIQVSEQQVREIMIPRAQMDVIDISQPPEQFIPYVIETAHSRFPVVDGDKDNIIGILLAKDLLRYYAGEEFNVRDMLRPAVFVPESKRLNVLLRDFRSNRNHIALVVDEYGGVCGMVTIEDVLEQIVGDIADEYDFDEDEDNIIRQDDAHWRVKADTEIADFNEILGTEFSDEDYDTIGGLVLKAAGQLPKRGEQIQIGEWQFTVLRADSRRLHVLLAERTLPLSGNEIEK